MGSCFRYLILLLLVWSCSREQDYLEFQCQVASIVPETKTIRCTIDTLEFDGIEEKGTSDFTLSVFIDRSMTFKEALGVLKGIVDEYRKVGLKVSVPEATIFRLDTLTKWKSSSEALYFFYNLRRGLTPKGTFSIYLTEGALGGIAYVSGRKKNVLPSVDVGVVFCNNIVKAADVFVAVHEVGHLLGSQHTHDCVWNGDNSSIDECVRVCSGLNEPGSVMSYCPNAWKNLYFHPQTLDTMKNNVYGIDLKYK